MLDCRRWIVNLECDVKNTVVVATNEGTVCGNVGKLSSSKMSGLCLVFGKEGDSVKRHEERGRNWEDEAVRSLVLPFFGSSRLCHL